MKKSTKKLIATNVGIAFFFVSIFILLIYACFYQKIKYYSAIVNTVAVNGYDDTNKFEYDYEAQKIVNYPDYGKKFGNLKIAKIDLNLPIYHGDDLSILKKGVGHYAGSYFPGEGGTVLFAAHNTSNFFKRFEELSVDDIVEIETEYGNFKYKVSSYKVVSEKDLDAFAIQDKREILIMYTCYPINRQVVGRRTQRYVVYAYRVSDDDE